jgi:hypothetical protein
MCWYLGGLVWNCCFLGTFLHVLVLNTSFSCHCGSIYYYYKSHKSEGLQFKPLQFGVCCVFSSQKIRLKKSAYNSSSVCVDRLWMKQRRRQLLLILWHRTQLWMLWRSMALDWLQCWLHIITGWLYDLWCLLFFAVSLTVVYWLNTWMCKVGTAVSLNCLQ